MQSYDNRLDDLLARRGELFEQLRALTEAQDGTGECAALSVAMVRAKIAGLDAQIAQFRHRTG
jgi:hypothetical protein